MKINEDIVPSTIEAAVNHIVASINDEDKANILKEPKIDVLTHHTVGQYLRNNWSLWDNDSPLKRNAIEKYGIAHADDISGLILRWAIAKIRNEEFDALEHCEIYKKHWAKLNMSALEAGGWK